MVDTVNEWGGGEGLQQGSSVSKGKEVKIT